MAEQRLRIWLLGLLTALAAVGVLYMLFLVLRALAPVLTVATIGGLLAVLLNPLANRVQRAIRSRPLSAFAVMLLLLAPFVLVLTWLITTVVREAQGLLVHLPTRLQDASNLLNAWQLDLQRIGIHVDLASKVTAASGSVLSHSISVLSSAASITTDMVLALVVAFFVIWDGEAMMRSARTLLSDRWRRPTFELAHIVATAVADYVRSQFLVAVIFGVMIGCSMALLRLPDPVLLGFLAGLFELLPSIGPILAALGPLGLSLAQPFPHVIWVLLVFIAAQQIESSLLVPRISGHAVGLHPLTVILAVFAGFHLGGLPGAFVAIPIAAAVREILRRWWLPAARVLPDRGARDTHSLAQAESSPPPKPAPSAPTLAVPPAPPAPSPGATEDHGTRRPR